MYVYEYVYLSVLKKNGSNVGNKKEIRWVLLLFGVVLFDFFIWVLDDFYVN